MPPFLADLVCCCVPSSSACSSSPQALNEHSFSYQHDDRATGPASIYDEGFTVSRGIPRECARYRRCPLSRGDLDLADGYSCANSSAREGPGSGSDRIGTEERLKETRGHEPDGPRPRGILMTPGHGLGR